ncbi:MAG: transaldolase, partial [Pseudonocardiales bacterium]|nr:transaldolase [Pseudonocardiales bacterium]
MQLLLDSADEKQVKYWAGQGVIDGVTTNPSVLRRDGVINPRAALANLASLITPGVLHAEVTEPSGQELVRQGV